nr:histidine kinase [Frondihabitans sp. VKM Ac-2883]
MLALYAATVYSRPSYGWIAALVGLAALVAVEYAVAGEPPRNVGIVGVAFVITLLIGSTIGNRRRYLQALLDRAAQLARERDQRGQLAAVEERSRIAREMHDVVAHGLSVMIRLSDGAEAVAVSDPERSREAVRQIGSVGRASLRDMRRLLGVLRDDDEVGFSPQPTLGELDDLIETYRSAGLPVAVQQRGTPPTDSTLQVAVYRGVQEALTNALRYSREPTRVLVVLDYGPVSTTVDITDDGIFLGAQQSVGSGRGLVGLRERAAAFGGTVEAGPAINPETGQDGGGWRVRMSLPTTLEGMK